MTKRRGVGRRDFLRGAGVTGAAAGLVAAQTLKPTPSDAAGEHTSHGHGSQPTGAEPTQFFTSVEAPVVVALVDVTPKDDVGWGAEWKRAVPHPYNHTLSIVNQSSVMAYRHNYFDLDPTYRDAFGQPLLRMTFDFIRTNRSRRTRLRTSA